jgi:hypothetical protein
VAHLWGLGRAGGGGSASEGPGVTEREAWTAAAAAWRRPRPRAAAAAALVAACKLWRLKLALAGARPGTHGRLHMHTHGHAAAPPLDAPLLVLLSRSSRWTPGQASTSRAPRSDLICRPKANRARHLPLEGSGGLDQFSTQPAPAGLTGGGMGLTPAGPHVRRAHLLPRRVALFLAC